MTVRMLCLFATAVVAVILVEPCRAQPNTERGRPDAATLWADYETARGFTFDSPWRDDHNARPWRESRERISLHSIVDAFPNSIHEARSRLLLAWYEHAGNRQRYHIISARNILLRLMEEAPQTPGLLQAVIDASRDYHRSYVGDGRSPFFPRALDYLNRRSKLSDSEATKAAFYYAYLYPWHHPPGTRRDRTTTRPLWEKQKALMQQLAAEHSNDIWGQCAAVHLLRGRSQDSKIEFLKFGDQYPDSPAGALALEMAAGGGRGRLRMPQRLELLLRLARQHPEGIDQLFLAPTPWQRYASREITDTPAANLDEVETLYQELLAIRPNTGKYLLSKLSDARGLKREYGSDNTERVQYQSEFWDRVEELALPEVREQVLLNRAWYFGGYSRESPQVADKASWKLLNEYPHGRFAPAALDALARRASFRREFDLANQYWSLLLERFPDHPLAPIAALESVKAQYSLRTPEAWRRAMSNVLRRFPDCLMMRIVVPYLIAVSFEHEQRYADAVAAYQRALKHWPDVFYGPEQHIGDLTDVSPFGGWNVTSTRSAVEKRVREFPKHRHYKGKDFVRWELHSRRAYYYLGNGRIDALQSFLEDFPDSQHAPAAIFQLGQLFEKRENWDAARDVYSLAAGYGFDEAGYILIARLCNLRLHYDASFRAAKPIDLSTALGEARALLQGYENAVRNLPATHPQSELQALALSLYRKRVVPLVETKLTRDPNNAGKWILFDGCHQITVDRYDGGQETLKLSPDFVQIDSVLMTNTGRHLSEIFDIKEDRPRVVQNRFVRDVLQQIIVIDQHGNLPGHGTESSWRPFYAYTRFTFLNAENTQVRASNRWVSDTGPYGEYLERTADKWAVADHGGWW